MFLNAGWLGGLVFLGLIGSTAVLGLRHALRRGATQPLFLVAYACFLANAVEGMVIDIDHWRHFYLLMALLWGMMLSREDAQSALPRPSRWGWARGEGRPIRWPWSFSLPSPRPSPRERGEGDTPFHRRRAARRSRSSYQAKTAGMNQGLPP